MLLLTESCRFVYNLELLQQRVQLSSVPCLQFLSVLARHNSVSESLCGTTAAF